MDNSAANSLYELLVTRDFEPEILDAAGKPITNPADAELFSFDYKTDGKNYGTVVVLLGAENDLQVYFGDNLGRSMDTEHKRDWYDFLAQLKQFAARNMLSFNLQNINRLKYTMQGMAAIKEGLFEGYYGSKKTSYSDQPKKTRLVIKHSRPLGEDEARYRYIESLFVETEQGERFRLPFTRLVGGKAMARHCSEGGNPYDTFGQHISEMMSEMDTLGRFVRAAKHRQFTGKASAMVERAIRHYQDIKTKAKQMISRRGYLESRERFDPAMKTQMETDVEEIRRVFVEQMMDHRIEQALPILAKLKDPAMPEANEFESWAHKVTEGTWSLPDTPEKKRKLQDLMSRELIVGPDATNATEQLYDILGDDVLFDILDDIALTDVDANIWDDERVQKRTAELMGVPVPQQDKAAVDENFGGGGLSGAPFGGTEPMNIAEAPDTYQAVKVKGTPREGDIHDLPGGLNGRMLPGLERLRTVRDDYSDTMYFRDPITGGIFAIYYHGRIPRLRGTDGMPEQRVAEIVQSLATQPQREDIDTDGVMMQTPSNMSSESRQIKDTLYRLIELARV